GPLPEGEPVRRLHAAPRQGDHQGPRHPSRVAHRPHLDRRGLLRGPLREAAFDQLRPEPGRQPHLRPLPLPRVGVLRPSTRTGTRVARVGGYRRRPSSSGVGIGARNGAVPSITSVARLTPTTASAPYTRNANSAVSSTTPPSASSTRPRSWDRSERITAASASTPASPDAAHHHVCSRTTFPLAWPPARPGAHTASPNA